MSKVIESEWPRVMDAYRKGNAMRLAELEKKRASYQSVFGSKGEKKTCDEILEIFMISLSILELVLSAMRGFLLNNPSPKYISLLSESIEIGPIIENPYLKIVPSIL